MSYDYLFVLSIVGFHVVEGLDNMLRVCGVYANSSIVHELGTLVKTSMPHVENWLIPA